MDAALRKVSDARARGVDVHADVYPYTAGSTKMANLLPAWAHDGGNARLLERLADGATRRRLIEECLRERGRVEPVLLLTSQIFREPGAERRLLRECGLI